MTEYNKLPEAIRYRFGELTVIRYSVQINP